jgi:DNA polymerase-3 subunit gamma/tau
MSESQVIARKFRPQAFAEVVGQEAITRTLSNALTSDRLHHAYLFTGARGVGKTTTARIFAKALNCVKGITTEPCGVCASCKEITASSSMDVLEIDAASNTGVDNVREVIINSIGIAPARDRYKIFIIDEVHMLSTSAFNALLKTLEEPPPKVVFIMATTELQKVPETILSRCQIFEFRTITLKKISSQLRHIADNLGVKISDSALTMIARAGDGSMRDAESALDQVISFAGLEITDADVSAALGLVDIETLNVTMRAIAEEDSSRLLRIVEEVVTRGYDLRNFCREMLTHIRALLVIKISGFDPELVQLQPNEAEPLVQLADAFSEQDLVRFFSILTKTEQDIRTSPQPRFQLEIGLVKLAQARRLYLVEEALSRLTEIQSQLGGAPISSSIGGATSTPLPRAKSSTPPQAASGGWRQAGRVTPPAMPQASQPAPVPASREVVQATPPIESAPKAAFTAFSTSEPPPLATTPSVPDDPFPYDLDSAETSSPSGGVEGTDAGKRLIEALEVKKKMMLVMVLEKAEIRIDGEFLRVSLLPENVRDKPQLDGRDKRQLIEETCREVFGRKLVLSVSVAGQALTEAEPKPRPAVRKKDPAPDIDPNVRALADKFGAKEIEIIPPKP